ncbi:hypothetical protein MMC29_004168, partial [Sticta canariensis]|nr:hypothetical protein [Sticta canariensis]
MSLFLLCIVFLTLGSPILNESLDPETQTADSDYLTPVADASELNGFDSGNSGGLGVKSTNTDLTAFNLPLNANTPENILTNPDLDPGVFDIQSAPASAGSSCLNDPIMDDSTANVKKKRSLFLPYWFDALPLWCPRNDNNVPLQPKPQLPSPPPASPSSPSPAPPILRPSGQPASYPQVDGGSEYGEIRSCSMFQYKYNTLICGGPPYPTDFVEEAKKVEDCWR